MATTKPTSGIVAGKYRETTMEFTRKRKKGMDSKTAKMWVSDCGHYQITWRNEVFGVKIPSQYQALVRSYVGPYADAQFWTFVGRRGPYRKLNAAIEASEKHRRLWDYAMKVAESERKGRNERLRVVDAKARIGTGPTCQRVMSSLPVWVRGKANIILMNQLFPRPGSVVEEDDECLDQKDSSLPEDDSTKPQFDPTDLSLSTEQKSSTSTRKTSSTSRKTRTSGPASDATAEAKSTTPTTRRARSKATDTAIESPAPSATETVVSPGRSSRKRTNSKSPSTSKKRSGSKRSSKPTEPASAS